MSNLHIVCPATGAKVDTGIGTDAGSLSKSWYHRARVQCPHCHVEHSDVVRELFVAQEISDERLHGAAQR